MTPRNILVVSALLFAACGDNYDEAPPYSFTLSGSVTGYVGSGLVLTDGARMLTLSSNATSYAFATVFHLGDPYAVTVKTQPTGPVQNCTIANATGNVTGEMIANVSCTTPGS